MLIMEPADFYTGLVADLYAVLRSVDPDPEPYARFITRWGEPALELGCGDGDPMLNLRQRGLHVEGLDSSSDMLDRCRARAASDALEVVLHHSTIESMNLGKRFRSIYLAGPTFNLIADDGTAQCALERIRFHLEPGGATVIPLFIPPPIKESQIQRATEHRTAEGVLLRCTTMSVHRDEAARRQAVVLRYERIDGAATEVVDREWSVHWHTPSGFRRLAIDAGLHVRSVRDASGGPASDDATQFAVVVTRSASATGHDPD